MNTTRNLPSILLNKRGQHARRALLLCMEPLESRQLLSGVALSLQRIKSSSI